MEIAGAAQRISPRDGYKRLRMPVLDSSMAFIDTGDRAARPIVFLHGNPTSSYVWRNVIPQLEPLGRCLAPDLIGMGQSGEAPAGSYRFVDHARYLDAWLDSVELAAKAVLVVHDWGSALGFHWARRHPDRVAGIAYMEAIVQPLTWDDWPKDARNMFQAFRSPAGEDLILKKNGFIEKVLPASVLRTLGESEMEVYRTPYLEPGEGRRPMLTWPRELPIDGEPEDVCEIVAAYGQWLEDTDVAKLLINADPGSILVGRQRDFCRGWKNQTEVTVEGLHFVQEDSPAEIGAAIAEFVRGLPA